MALPNLMGDLRFWRNLLLAGLIGLIVGGLLGLAVRDWTHDIEDRIERLEQVADSTAIER